MRSSMRRTRGHRDAGTARLAAVLAAAGLVLAACGGDGGTADPADDETAAEEGGDDAAAEDGGGSLSLSVGVDAQNFMTNMPLYVGRELGYFEEAGISDLEITVTGDQFAAALLSGSVDISHTATLDWFAAGSQSGEPIRVIATLRDREYIQLGVRPGIESADDLRGGRVTGGPAGGDNENNLRFVLDELGLEPGTDVEIVPSDPGSDNWLAAVLNEQLDGAMMFGRHILALEEAGGKFLYQETRDAPQDGFATTQSFLDDNPDAVAAFIEGLVATKQYYQDLDNREEILQIMRDNGFEVTPELEASYEVEIEQQSVDGGFEVAAMEEMVQRGIDQEKLPADFDWTEWVALDPLHQAQEANGLSPRPEMS